jgi:hypothetical protein
VVRRVEVLFSAETPTTKAGTAWTAPAHHAGVRGFDDGRQGRAAGRGPVRRRAGGSRHRGGTGVRVRWRAQGRVPGRLPRHPHGQGRRDQPGGGEPPRAGVPASRGPRPAQAQRRCRRRARPRRAADQGRGGPGPPQRPAGQRRQRPRPSPDDDRPQPPDPGEPHQEPRTRCGGRRRGRRVRGEGRGRGCRRSCRGRG